MSPPSAYAPPSGRVRKSLCVGRFADYAALDIFAFQREGAFSAEEVKEKKATVAMPTAVSDTKNTVVVHFDPGLFQIGSAKKECTSSSHKTKKGKKHKGISQSPKEDRQPKPRSCKMNSVKAKSSTRVSNRKDKEGEAALSIPKPKPKPASVDVSKQQKKQSSKSNRSRPSSRGGYTPRRMMPYSSPRVMNFNSPQMMKMQSRRRSRLNSLIRSKATSIGEEFDPDLLETTDDEENVFHAPFDERIVNPQHPNQSRNLPRCNSGTNPPKSPMDGHNRESKSKKPEKSRSKHLKRSLLHWIANKACRNPSAKYQ